jgi:hypothetical protein
MATIQCPECGNMVSDQATACVKCGCPLKPKPNKVMVSFPPLPSQGQILSTKYYVYRDNKVIAEGKQYATVSIECNEPFEIEVAGGGFFGKPRATVSPGDKYKVERRGLGTTIYLSKVDAIGSVTMSDQNPTVIVKTQKNMGCLGTIGLIVVICAVIGMYNFANKGGFSSSSTGTTSRTAQTSQYTLDLRPDSQKQFEQIISTYSAEFDKGANELQQSTARNNRRKAFQQSGIKSAAGWVGTLTTLSTNGEGKAWVYIDLGNGITIGTYNNAFSDIGSNTLIPIESELFKALSGMSEKSKVKFTGTFFTGDDTDYLELSALTISGAMKNPHFVMKFSSVSVIGNKPITTSDINLREQPSSGSDKVMTIPKGSEVTLLGNAADDGWIKIDFEDNEGYVNKQYLTY